MYPRLSDRSWIALSLAALVVGAIFPLWAKISDPYMGYGIVIISWPAWAGGAVAGAIVGLRTDHQELFRWAWVLCAANVLAAIATLLIPFHAS